MLSAVEKLMAINCIKEDIEYFKYELTEQEITEINKVIFKVKERIDNRRESDGI